ncbi:MAG TPA: ABC transporter ATP-binding protein [Jatrophihabitantaceae bacterium]|nr:ABC transporter ATP-binding protein [Jatrophihabitantaceae bacterium]
MLELDHVSVHYGRSWAVRDISAAVAPGEWVGLIGANGAGKSSLLRAIAQLEPHDGTVRVDGRALPRISRRQQARLVAYVPQTPELPAGMTVAEYTLLGRTPHLGYLSVESDADRTLCRALLARLGLDALAGRTLSALSGGEAQRVVLARALAQQAPVLLLDEPTSALDLGNRVDALELVDELRRERGLTVLSAMHDLTLAAQFTDRLLLLAAGRLAAAGTPAEVLDEALLSHCFGGRVRVLPDELGGLVVVPVRRERATT